MSSISDIKNEIFRDLEIKKEEKEKNKNIFINQTREKIFGETTSDEIDINMLEPFNENPFKLCSSEDLEELAESIKDEGLLNPIILWKQEDSYTILSGHNRIEALKLLGYEKLDNTMYKIKENISLDDARLILVDPNLVQRKEILPSERAKAYNIQQKALMDKDTNRNIKNIFEDVLNTGEMAEDKDLYHDVTKDKKTESRMTIFRYLRLNQLITKLLDKVDEKEIGLAIAVELSYLDKDAQEEVFIYFFVDKVEKLNLEIAKKIRKEHKKMPINRNTLNIITEKMKKKKGNKQSYKINVKDIEEITDKSFNNEKEARDFILKCIKFYEENNRE